MTDDNLHESQITSGSTADRDHRLQLVRRIDWRFLLPDPTLRVVALLGNGDKNLQNALQQFSQSLNVYDPRTELTGTCDADLVVLCSSQMSDARYAVQMLKPGGSLYWELNHVPWSAAHTTGEAHHERAQVDKPKKRHLIHRPHFREYVAYTKRLNIDNAQVNWHRPNYDTCLEIIPLDDFSATRYVFSRETGGRMGQFKMRVGRMMLASGLLARFVPNLSIVGTKKS